MVKKHRAVFDKKFL